MTRPQPQPAAVEPQAPKTERDGSDIPAGDSPPKPAWPLVVGVTVWVLWIGFLLAMMVVRMRTSAV